MWTGRKLEIQEAVWEKPGTEGAYGAGERLLTGSPVSPPLKLKKNHLGLMDGSAPDWHSLLYDSRDRWARH